MLVWIVVAKYCFSGIAVMNNWLAISTSIILALILMLLPMPSWTIWLQPAWVLLILIYWTMALPYQVGIGTVWVVGLIVDLLSGTILGEHALAFTIVIYFIARIQIRLKMYPLLQQGVCILLFVLTNQFIIYCVQGFLGELPNNHLYWLSSVTSLLLWPWLFVLMRDFQRWFRVT